MIKALILLLAAAFCSGAPAISRANIRYVEYPDMANPHSSWGGICYSSASNKVIVTVCNHTDQIGLFEWDCEKKAIARRGWVAQGGHLQGFQWQGKVHSQVVENLKDGWLYFGTDGGESREENYMDHPNGYFGGFFMKYNPKTFELINLGNGRRYESIKEVGIDPVRQRVYGITYPADHLIIKDLATDSLYDKGCINKAHVGRTLFTDDWGNAYYTDMRGTLIKYEAAADSLIWADQPLARDTGVVEGWVLRSGNRAWARFQKTNEYYFTTSWSRIFKITVQEKGVGPIEDMGYILNPTKDLELKTIMSTNCPNLYCHPNHKLYMWAGGHNSGMKKNITSLIEVDPIAKTKKIVYDCPWTEMEEATGSQCVDKDGNIYFAARRHVDDAAHGESGSSRAILVVFNPEKEINK
ncbi:MAG: hypothetical protein V1913_01035 [Fibrobacterota bacterium]